jgi:hypothetical protein
MSDNWAWIFVLIVILSIPMAIGCCGMVDKRRRKEREELKQRRRQPDWELYP